jgi:hypothetical protein
MAKKLRTTIAKKLPAPANNDNAAWHLFGPPPLLKGEDPAKFAKFLNKISTDVKPTDTIEHVWVWDIVVLTWEVMRYRRAIAALHTVNTVRGLESVLGRLHGEFSLPKLLVQWEMQDPEAVEYVESLLKRAGLTMEDVAAQTMSLILGDIERLDGMAMRAQAQRNSLHREIERRQSTFDAALRKSVDEIHEGEFTEIGTSVKNVPSAA